MLPVRVVGIKGFAQAQGVCAPTWRTSFAELGSLPTAKVFFEGVLSLGQQADAHVAETQQALTNITRRLAEIGEGRAKGNEVALRSRRTDLEAKLLSAKANAFGLTVVKENFFNTIGPGTLFPKPEQFGSARLCALLVGNDVVATLSPTEAVAVSSQTLERNAKTVADATAARHARWATRA